MAEEAKTAEASNEEAAENDNSEESQAESNEGESGDGSEGSGDAESGSDDSGSEGESGGKGESEGGEEDAGSSEKSESTDQKPRTRRSASARIQGLVAEKKALAEENEALKQGNAEGDSPSAPDVEALVNKALQKTLNPVLDSVRRTADDAEIDELFSGKPKEERTKLEPVIRKMWEEPQYKDVSAEDLYRIAAFKDAQAQGAQKSKDADDEAKKQETGGSSSRSKSKTKSVADMTDEEFQAHNEKVKAKL